MDFNEIILACFTDEEVYKATLVNETDCINAHMDKVVDSILRAGFLPQALINSLRRTADDLESAYEDDES